MSSVAEPRGRPIAGAIVALVVGAVLASTIVLFVVTFSGPPPMRFPVRLGEIADRLKGHGPPWRRGSGGPFDRDGPRVTVTRTAGPPAIPARYIPQPAAAGRLATLLDSPPATVSIASDAPADGFGDRADEFTGTFVAAWHAPDGWRVARSVPRPWLTRWHKVTLLAILLETIVLGVAAWVIARAITQPLRQLAGAAERARAGARRPDFPQDGPAEVRALTDAVAAMHDRLSGHAEQRTAMLAAIAHDLGTPLSRLAFWVEQLDEPARERAARDIDEMRAMIGDTVALARDEAGARDTIPVELSSLLDALVEDMGVGGETATLVPGDRAIVGGDPRDLRRAFANLIGNALRYGQRATVSWTVDGGEVTVAIADDGPGIDPAQAERLFEPFVRGEASRNRATGGSGLGLAIVRSIATRHGGTATLANRAGGGAVATVRLPLAR